MEATVTLLLVIVVLLLAAKLMILKSKGCPPGPFPWPFIGNRFLVDELSRKYGSYHMAYWEIAKQYGNVYTLHLGINKVIMICGNKAILSALRNDSFTGRPWTEFIKLRNMGKKQGITMNDGQEWKEIRGWMVQTLKQFGFGKQTMSDLIMDELSATLNDLKGGGIVQMRKTFTSAVINVVWRFASGKRFCKGEKLQYFIDLMERRSQLFDMSGGLMSNFPWIRRIAPRASGYNLLLALNKELKDFLMETVNEHKAKFVLGSEADLIDSFLNQMAKSKGQNPAYTDDQLVMVLIDLFFAGISTTAITLEFLTLTMAVHQDIQRKLHKEIDATIPFDRLPNLGDKAKMPYTEAIISEVMRMWPTFPVIGPRRVLEDTYLEGYEIPKETTILVNIYSVNRDPQLYHEPDEFKPERYIKNGVFETDVNSLVFGKGKRRCPGEVLAKAATFIIFVGVMQKFQILPVPGVGPTSVEINSGITISPKPYDLLLVPRMKAQS